MTEPNPLIQPLQDWTEIFMRQMMRDFGRFARENGLSMPQMGALFNLYHKGKISVSVIGDELGVTSPAASQMLDRLVQQGFLARSEDPDDRRVKQIVLTPKGIDVIKASIRMRREWLEKLTEFLTTEEQGSVAMALDLLTQAAQKFGNEKNGMSPHRHPAPSESFIVKE